jgi:hypothetical protein
MVPSIRAHNAKKEALVRLDESPSDEAVKR